jgi:hypothetical protein
VGHVARMGTMTSSYKILVDKPKGKRPLKDSGVDWWIKLK